MAGVCHYVVHIRMTFPSVTTNSFIVRQIYTYIYIQCIILL